MIYYELKKIFSSWGSRVALVILAAMVALNCWTATNAVGTGWVNEAGKEETGIAAVRKLREARKEWAGMLDTEKLTAALKENQRINATPEAQSGNYEIQDIAYGWKQGIMDIRQVINHFLAVDFSTYDYYRADSVRVSDLPRLYDNRVALLEEYLAAGSDYTEAEKQWLVERYEALDTPMYYDWFTGWNLASDNSMLLTMVCSWILGYLVAGIFSNEFKWKADAIYFSSLRGRKESTKAKIAAGFLLVTVVYWVVMGIYSLYTLVYLGVDGWNCPVQLDRWKCFYNITFLEKYLLVLLAGYLGNLFSAFFVMWVAARTRTAVVAVTLPFLSVFLPNFLENYDTGLISRILGLLPCRLLDLNYAINNLDVYSIGKLVVGALPLLFLIYGALTIFLVPVMYREFRRKEIC